MDDRFLSGGAFSEMEADDTDYATEAPLPSPAGTPYRTPLMSRHASRHATPSQSPSPYPLSSSPPTTNGRTSPLHRMSMSHHHDTFDDTISILDPRRFTPTLHANLVAEILSLRRDLESKANLIDTLEHDLSAARSEHETATTSVATAQREARDVRRQLARVENDDAVEAVAKERDDAVEAIAELKRQVERLTKSRRGAEEDLERVKTTAEQDQERFEDSKRALERRAHVAEGRLKALLDELSAANAMPPPPTPVRDSSDPEYDDAPSEVALSDTASIRTSIQERPGSVLMGDDVAERLGIRFSMLSGSQGLSLADELVLGGEEYDEIQEDDDEGDRTETEAEATGDAASGSGSDTQDEEQAREEDPQPTPEYCEMGIQVDLEEKEEPERPEIFLLEESRAALERTYADLDRKSSELECTYVELNKAHGRIGDLEEQIDGLAEEVAEKKRVLVDQDIDYAHKIKMFEARGREVEERWMTVEAKEKALDKREWSLDERSRCLGIKEGLLEEKEAIFIPLPDSPVDTDSEHAFSPICDNEVLPADNDTKLREGEYEANQRRKRSAGVTSPPPPHPSAPPAPIYESVETQTEPVEERPPTPPPRSPTRPPLIATQTAGTQTEMEPLKPPALRIIPTIAVTPPPPTPPLPGQPLARTRDVSAQTRSIRSKTRSVQTDEIPFEERMMRLPARLLPAAILASNVPSLPAVPPTQPERLPPSPPKKSSKRSIKRISTMVGGIPTSVPRSMLPALDSPGPPGHALIYSPPRIVTEFEGTHDNHAVRRQLFNGVDLSQDLPQSSGDDDFRDDADLSENEFTTALSAPRPKKQRNHVSNSGRPSTVVENPDSPHYEAYSRRPPSIRRNVLVTSSVQAHSRTRSPSLNSTWTSESGGQKIGPPFPVPIRNSSRKPVAYANSRNESPTPMSAGLPRRTLPLSRRHSIRKVRSAAALPSLRTSNHRNRSPPPLSASSAAPDSPLLPPLPKDEVLSPAFEKQKFGSSKHKHQASTNTSNTGNASVGSSIQQISVVDAIAQTMVGEWMWKYVRRRRSFGVPDSPQAWDGRDEGTSGGGQRHKRWVWLAPYERAVMWSSRQPTSGNALLGKSGRKRKRSIFQPPAGLSMVLDKVLMNKVPIQSVLDVKDDTPLPKGVNPGQPLFNRSILILTPARALKFTAPNKERHYVWLTALSFLSHSAHESEGLLALPPPMPFEYDQMQQQRPPSPPTVRAPPPIPPIPAHRDPPFHPIRDSIRIAKGKSRAVRSETNGYSNPGSLGKNSMREMDRHGIMTNGDTFAEPPSIPRFPGHSRKRPGTNRSGYNASMHSSYGGSFNGDYYPGMGVGGIGLISGNSSISHGVPGHAMSGWEAGPMGTVRMEAFVDPKPKFEFDEEDEYRGNQPSSYRLRRDRRSSRHESYWSGNGDFYAGSSSVKGGSVMSGSVDGDSAVTAPFRGDDPFRGF